MEASMEGMEGFEAKMFKVWRESAMVADAYGIPLPGLGWWLGGGRVRIRRSFFASFGEIRQDKCEGLVASLFFATFLWVLLTSFFFFLGPPTMRIQQDHERDASWTKSLRMMMSGEPDCR